MLAGLPGLVAARGNGPALIIVGEVCAELADSLAGAGLTATPIRRAVGDR